MDHVLNITEVEISVGLAEPDGITNEDRVVAEVDTEVEGETAEGGQDCDYYDGGRRFMLHYHPQILDNNVARLFHSISHLSQCRLNGDLTF